MIVFFLLFVNISRNKKCNFSIPANSVESNRSDFVYFLTLSAESQDSILDKCILHGLYWYYMKRQARVLR